MWTWVKVWGLKLADGWTHLIFEGISKMRCSFKSLGWVESTKEKESERERACLKYARKILSATESAVNFCDMAANY